VEHGMSLALLLSFQAAAAAAAPVAPRDVRAVDFDLAKYRSDANQGVESLFACAPSPGPDIVVCGRRRGGAYPLGEMGRIFEYGPLRAETRIGGANLDAHVESFTFSNGMISKRLMVRLKLPF
ncbi:MAG: hypothetical protein JWO81_1162, partial [Alphaproteobacteria bacterium]|nr:hypothetical protein [Alphaproteobacteria bacterium]